jgi:hypothetical protein
MRLIEAARCVILAVTAAAPVISVIEEKKPTAFPGGAARASAALAPSGPFSGRARTPLRAGVAGAYPQGAT